jgi:aerobic carbon-monoxide dehydrogenase large subunit
MGRADAKPITCVRRDGFREAQPILRLLTGTLMDHGIPRTDTLPRVTVDFSPVPSPTNPVGAKGVGEGGTVASTPTVMNAILDALAPLGVADVPMPATPERIWRAMHELTGA